MSQGLAKDAKFWIKKLQSLVYKTAKQVKVDTISQKNSPILFISGKDKWNLVIHSTFPRTTVRL